VYIVDICKKYYSCFYSMQVLLWLAEYGQLTIKFARFMDRNQFNLYLF